MNGPSAAVREIERAVAAGVQPTVKANRNAEFGLNECRLLLHLCCRADRLGVNSEPFADFAEAGVRSGVCKQDGPMLVIREAAHDALGGLAGWQLDLAVRLVLSDLSTDIPVSELANRCGLSRSHFARAFKASMGLPPHRWVMQHRIDLSQAMLESSKECIADIALCCGFADQSHFTRVFHALQGLSPAAWRRQCKAGKRLNG